MNIGVDIDDTISNSFEIIFGDSQIFDIEEMNGTGKVKNIGNIPNHYYIENMYDWDEKSIEKFWYKYFKKVLVEATPKPYVKEILKKLKDEGNKIYLITARYEQEGIESVENLTKEWLEKHNITYDKLLMNSEDKLKIAQENKIDIFIDDCLKNCKEVAEGKIKTYMFASIGNIMVDSKDIEKIYSWPQFYFEVNKFTKNSQ